MHLTKPINVKRFTNFTCEEIAEMCEGESKRSFSKPNYEGMYANTYFECKLFCRYLRYLSPFTVAGRLVCIRPTTSR